MGHKPRCSRILNQGIFSRLCGNRRHLRGVDGKSKDTLRTGVAGSCSARIGISFLRLLPRDQLMQSQMQMMKIMRSTQFDVLAHPETANKLAAYTRNYYNALIEAAFTKEEAPDIAKNIGIPAAPMMVKQECSATP